MTDDASTKGLRDNPLVAGNHPPNNQVKTEDACTSDDACDTINLVTELSCGSSSAPCGDVIVLGCASENDAINLQTKLCNNCAAIGIESVALFYAATKSHDMIKQASKQKDSCGVSLDEAKHRQRLRRPLDDVNPGTSIDITPGYESDDSLVVTKRRLSRESYRDGRRRKSYHERIDVAMPDMGIE